MLFTFSDPPELISTSSLQETSPNTPFATLSCSFDANPEPTIHWFYQNQQIGEGEILKISSPKWQNSGEYICQANNNHGDIKTASAFLSVYGKPKIYSAKMDIQENLDEKSSKFVNFDCGFVSFPKVKNSTVKCSKNVNPVKISNNQFRLPVEKFDLSSKCYCEVENILGTDEMELLPENPAFFESQVKSENFSTGELLLVLICTILFLSAMLLISFSFWVCWKRRMNSGHFTSKCSQYNPKLESRSSHITNSSEKMSLADSRRSLEYEEAGKLIKINNTTTNSYTHPDSSSGISSYVILDGSEPENKKLIVKNGNNGDISLGSDRHSSSNEENCHSGSSGHGTMAMGSGSLPISRKNKVKKSTTGGGMSNSKSMNCSLNTSASDDLYDPSRIRQISEIMQQVKPAKKIKSITHV